MLTSHLAVCTRLVCVPLKDHLQPLQGFAFALSCKRSFPFMVHWPSRLLCECLCGQSE
jgi:hypothetical protein